MKKALMFFGVLIVLFSASSRSDACEQQALDEAKLMTKKLVNSQIMSLDEFEIIEKGDPGGFADCCWSKDSLVFVNKETRTVAAKYYVSGGNSYELVQKGVCISSVEKDDSHDAKLQNYEYCQSVVDSIAKSVFDSLAKVNFLESTSSSRTYHYEVSNENQKIIGSIRMSAIDCRVLHMSR